MRCPECGYHGFAHMNRCKKCGCDLSEFKARYGISEEIPLSALERASRTSPQVTEGRKPSADHLENHISVDCGESVFNAFPKEPEEGARELFIPDEEQDGLKDVVDEKFVGPGRNGADETIAASRIALPAAGKVGCQESAGKAVRVFEQPVSDQEESEDEVALLSEVDTLRFPDAGSGNTEADGAPFSSAIMTAADSASEENRIFSRLGAFLADCSILSLVFLLFAVLGKIGLDPQPRQALFPTQAVLLFDLLSLYFFLFFSVSFGYFTVFHFLTGQTPGKMLFNIRVEDENGHPLLFSQAFLRSAGGLFSFLVLGLGYLMVFFDPDGRGWNDRLAGTRVVKVEPAS